MAALGHPYGPQGMLWADGALICRREFAYIGGGPAPALYRTLAIWRKL
jgi:hypothetical protein